MPLTRQVGFTIKTAESLMLTRTDADSFEKIVEWAFSTLPQKIRDLPDFPGIQVMDEPPAYLYERVSNRRNWPRGAEMLGCYSGIPRTGQRLNQLRGAPDLIFVFRGPILRCSGGNLPAEVKQVVWHEVAHWLGHNEQEVKELGLARDWDPVEDASHGRLEIEAPADLPRGLKYTPEESGPANEPQRCPKCYSADIDSREVDRPLTPEAWLNYSTVRVDACACKSCGYQCDNDDT